LLVKKNRMKKLVNSIVVTASSHEMPMNGISKSLELLGVSSPLEIEGARICSITDWIKKASARGSSNPGRALQIALSEIFLANLDNPIQTHWGWADHRNTNLLDFWHEFDDQIRFLLVVESPHHLLARLTLEGGLSDGESRLLVLTKWAQSVEKIISFYRSWPDICLLTNSLAWSHQESEVFQSVATWLALDEKEVEFKDNNELQDQSLLVLSQFLKLDSGEMNLVDPLWQQVIALSPSPDQPLVDNSSLLLAEQSFAQLKQFKIDMKSLQIANQTKSEQVSHLQAEIKGIKKQITSLESELSFEKTKPQFDSSLELKLKDSEQENELLLLQLHQVQEELEDYFLKFQDTKSQLNNAQTDLETANARIRKLDRQLKNLKNNNGNLCQYEDIQLIRYFSEPGYESIWIALENAKIGNHHWPHFEFRFSAANVQPDGFSDQPHYEFPRLQNSAQVFENWFVESSDELRGDRYELRFNLGQGAMDMHAWDTLSKLDQARFIALIQSIPGMLDDLAEFNDLSIRSLEDWKALNQRSLELIAALVSL
jgi:hypothetical protein